MVSDDVQAGDMIAAVKEAGIADMTDAEVFDVYRGAQVGEGMKSIAMNFSFASPVRTLTDDEIAAEMAKILALLEGKFDAKIRA